MTDLDYYLLELKPNARLEEVLDGVAPTRP
jgi:hypothetical protein